MATVPCLIPGNQLIYSAASPANCSASQNLVDPRGWGPNTLSSWSSYNERLEKHDWHWRTVCIWNNLQWIPKSIKWSLSRVCGMWENSLCNVNRGSIVSKSFKLKTQYRKLRGCTCLFKIWLSVNDCCGNKPCSLLFWCTGYILWLFQPCPLLKNLEHAHSIHTRVRDPPTTEHLPAGNAKWPLHQLKHKIYYSQK